jgi:hypothetical protein
MISLYGHFPDVDDSHPATVTYKGDGIGEQTVNLKPYVGGSLGFQLPASYLKEGRFVELSISIPKTIYYFFPSHTTLYTRVYVETVNAFSIKIDEFEENPNLWQVVASPAEHIERADSNRTSNVGAATAPQLFSTLINDNATYDQSSATFTKMDSRVSSVGPPCWCGCSGSSARMAITHPLAMSVDL